MTDTNSQEAAELAEKAGEQAKTAGKAAKAAVSNGGKAAVAVAEPVIENATEKVEETAGDVVQAARKLDMSTVSAISSDLGIGFISLAISIAAGRFAYGAFRSAITGGKSAVNVELKL